MRSLLLAGLLCLPAFAQQTYEFSVVGGYSRLSRSGLGSLSQLTTVNDDDTRLKGEYSYGARLTVNTRGYYGHELGYTFTRARFDTIVRTIDDDDNEVETPATDRVVIQEATYNFLMYMMPNGERWRPYVTVGAQSFLYGAPSFEGWPGGGAWRNYGVNFGVGLKLKANRFIFRIDARDYVQGKPYGLTFEEFAGGGMFHHLQGTVGVGFTF